MAASSAFPGLWNSTTSAEDAEKSSEIPLESIPLYYIANYLLYICSPIVILLGTFGNVMTIVIMQRMTSGESVIHYYFTSMAAMDLIVLFSASFKEWLNITFHYQLQDVNSPFCKIIVWLSTGSGTISCWYLVCLTLHRAMSVVWPHRVSVMCTRPTVLGVLLGIGLFFAALYAHYLFGFDLVSSDGGITGQCLMESDTYIQFVVNVFAYMELGVYSLLPFVCLVVGNSILVWRLSASIKDSHGKFRQGNTEQMVAREKAANSVTLTVIVVSVTFVVLTLPVSVNYILSYFAREYNQVSGHEYAKVHMFYTISYLLADCNSAVNFYLYCLTGRRFREEFGRLVRCGKGMGSLRGSRRLPAVLQQTQDTQNMK